MEGIRWRYIVLVFLGAWNMLLPVLGFPRNIKNWLFVVTGLLVALCAYYAYVGSFNRLLQLRRSVVNPEPVLHDQEEAQN